MRNQPSRGMAAIHLLPSTLLMGCLSAGFPRTADVLRPGDVGGSINLTLSGLASGSVDVKSKEGIDDERGNTSWSWGNNYTLYVGPGLGGLELEGRVGVGSGCEVGLVVGYTRAGTEGRCSALDEDVGRPISVALFAGGGVQYGMVTRAGPWARAGLDTSRRFGGLAPTGNIFLSYGDQHHRLNLSGVKDDDVGMGYSVPPTAALDRAEVRLNAGGGLTLFPGDGGGFLYAGAIPYFTLWNSEARMDCVGCDGGESVVGFHETWGVMFMVGGGGMSKRSLEPIDATSP